MMTEEFICFVSGSVESERDVRVDNERKGRKNGVFTDSKAKALTTNSTFIPQVNELRSVNSFERAKN